MKNQCLTFNSDFPRVHGFEQKIQLKQKTMSDLGFTTTTCV